MPIKINCKWNDRGAWCTNKKIKRSMFGIGVRRCVEYPASNYMCKEKVCFPRPPAPPPPPKPRRQDEGKTS